LKGVKNWGFTIPLPDDIPSDGLVFELVAGAGQCDLSKGRCDGTVTMYQEADGSFRFEVVGNSLNSVIFYGVHVYIGEDPLPIKGNGKKPRYSNAPGQFPCSMEVNGEASFTLQCAALKRGVDADWVAFHVESSGTTTAAGQAECSFG
jgi:hypothetical protein